MERLYSLVVRRAPVVLALLGALSIWLGLEAARIRFDGSVESLLPADDPGGKFYEGVRQTFGSDEIGVVGVLAEQVLTPDVLGTIDRLTKRIGALEGVERVISLTNASDPVKDVIEPPLLVPHPPRNEVERTELEHTLLDRPVFLKNLVAPDFRAAAINVFFRTLTEEQFLGLGLDEKISEILAEERQASPGVELHYTGLPHFKTYSTMAMQRDLLRFVPVTLAIILVVLFLGFRSFRGVWLPAFTVVLTLVWTLGVMRLSGAGLSLGTMALPPLVLVLGTAYSLHVLAEYVELVKPGVPRAEVVLETMRQTVPPLFIATLTTIAGFVSLLLNSIRSIREMGLYSSIGIAFAFTIAVVVVPAFLAILPLRAGRPNEIGESRLGRLLVAAASASMKHRLKIVVVSAVLSVLCILPILHIQVDTNFLSFFRASDPIRVATEAINQRIVGSMAFYVVIDADKPGQLKSFDNLLRIRELQRFVDGLPGVDKTVSFVDYAEMLDRGAQQPSSSDFVVDASGSAVAAPKAAETNLWDSPQNLARVLSLVAANPKAFSAIVDPDFRRMAIVVRTSLSRSKDINAVAEQVVDHAETIFPPELHATPTGNLLLLTRTTGDIVSGQAQSLALTAGVIFVVMSAMFLSFRVGVIAMIPNLLPILVFFALLGLTGAPLNFGTNIIASITLGVGVDETIHIMSRLSSEVRETANPQTALLETLRTVGRPTVLSSMLLFFGFLVLGLSTFVPISEFGTLSAATMIIGTFAEISLLPALLAGTRIITLWDLLYLKLGPNPHRTIPLFANLRPFQAKIVALMAELKAFPKGQPIVKQGDTGHEMFVIISGRVSVEIHDGGETRPVRQLRRGDVFGEMGLLRSAERTADVVPTEDVEVVAMDDAFLRRLQRRYPRTATKILANVARILSDRLQEVTLRAARAGS